MNIKSHINLCKSQIYNKKTFFLNEKSKYDNKRDINNNSNSDISRNENSYKSIDSVDDEASIQINKSNELSLNEEVKSNTENKNYKNKKLKKRKKYNKNHKSELRREILYLEIIENEKKWKYSLKYYDENRTKIYYNCMDSNCSAKGILNITETEKNQKKLENNRAIKDTFELSKNNSLDYSEHSYNIIANIMNDIETLSIETITNKLKNYYYLKDFVKAYTILNKEKNLTQQGLLKDIENKYGKLKIYENSIKKRY